MGLPIEQQEKKVWLIQRYHSHILYSDRLEQSLVWVVESLAKMLLQFEAMSVNEVYVKMIYEKGYSPIVDVYACGKCRREPAAIDTKISTNGYSCIAALVTTDCHDSCVQEWSKQDNSVSAILLKEVTGFSVHFDWCAPWLSVPGYYDGRDWIRDRKVGG